MLDDWLIVPVCMESTCVAIGSPEALLSSATSLFSISPNGRFFRAAKSGFEQAVNEVLWFNIIAPL